MTHSTKEHVRRWTLDLGKVDANGRGRKVNRVTVDVELRLKANDVSPQLDIDLEPCREYTELSICGAVWNAAGTDCQQAGQCDDTLAKLFPGHAKVKRLVEIWKRWHLNGMKAGTRTQNAFLADAPPTDNWDAKCRMLERADLLEVMGGPELENANGAHVRRSYKYGSAWLVEPLPPEVEAEIVALCGELSSSGPRQAEPDPKDFAEEHAITATARRVDKNPHMTDDKGMDHYKVTLRREAVAPDGMSNRLVVYFSKGSAHHGKRPTAIEVLGCLASDAATMVNCRNFEEWADEFGMSPDSRKAEKTYNATRKQCDELKRFLGDGLFRALLEDVN